MNVGQPATAETTFSMTSDLEELRGEALTLALLAVVGLVLVLIWAVLLVTDTIWRQAGLIVPALGAAAFGAQRLRSKSIPTAAATLCGGLTLILAGVLFVFPSASLVYWFALVVVLASTLLGSGYGAVIAAVATAIVALVLRGQPEALPGGLALGALLFVWTSALLAWLASRPMGTALAWAWNSYAQSLRTTQELRERQRELNRAMKSLGEVNYRLQQANLELARARSAAEEVRRLKAEFAANISHELRTPLNLIIGFSEMMAMAPETYGSEALPVIYREDVNAIYRSARHLANLVDDVLDLGQLDAGRMALSKERVALGQVVAEAVETVESILVEKGLWLKVDLPPSLPQLYVDRTRIRQVFINLLSNAARFTDQGGVTITVRHLDTDVEVAVADTGVGIAPEDIPKAFEEFRQLDGSTHRRHGGSGLGLAICRKFVDLHGGSIWAESQSGGGSTFFFTLPICENVVSSPARREWEAWVQLPETADELDRKVAVVSEDPATARVFQRYLDGYRVLPLSDPAELSEVAGQGTIHAVVVATHPDAVAPVAAQLGEVPRAAPLVTCSLPSGRDIARQVGVDAYLLKPVSRERLQAVLGPFGQGRRTILVVDDDPEMVSLLARMIRASSRRYQVLRAYGGDEALALLRQKRRDGLVLDLLMPEVDGYTVLRQMKAAPSLHRPAS